MVCWLSVIPGVSYLSEPCTVDFLVILNLLVCNFLVLEFSVQAMLCLQLADGVWPSFIKRITYLLTYLCQGGAYAIRLVCLSFCLSVWLCAASCKKLCMDLHDIFTKVRSWPSLKLISFWRWSRLIFTVI